MFIASKDGYKVGLLWPTTIQIDILHIDSAAFVSKFGYIKKNYIWVVVVTQPHEVGMKIESYEKDIVAWANEQARFLRAGRFDLLDLENIAEEIEDVGKSEKREFVNRMAVLLAHLLKWQHQPERRGAIWEITIRNQRRGINRRLDDTPSLKAKLKDLRWWSEVWDEAIAQAAIETGLADFPEVCPWSRDEIFSETWFPS